MSKCSTHRVNTPRRLSSKNDSLNSFTLSQMLLYRYYSFIFKNIFEPKRLEKLSRVAEPFLDLCILKYTFPNTHTIHIGNKSKFFIWKFIRRNQ